MTPEETEIKYAKEAVRGFVEEVETKMVSAYIKGVQEGLVRARQIYNREEPNEAPIE